MFKQGVTVQSWLRDEPATEQNIRQLLAAEGLQPYRWSNGPGEVYSAHTHSYEKVIYVVEGSITFGLPDHGEEVDLQEGDRLELASGMRHNAIVGPRGVVCLEAHR